MTEATDGVFCKWVENPGTDKLLTIVQLANGTSCMILTDFAQALEIKRFIEEEERRRGSG